MDGNPPKANPPKQDLTAQMSFLDHLEEMRWRIIKGLAGVFAGVIIAAVFSDFLIDTVLLGPTKSTFFMYEWIGINASDLDLQSRKLAGQFFTYWGAVFSMGIIIGAPVFFYQIWLFVAPALETGEKMNAFLTTLFISFFFLLGVAFGYLILVPFALQFFVEFQISDVIRNDFDINEYFSSFITWIFACGIVFQIPVISFFLARIGLVTPQLLRKFRRHSIVLFLILAAFLTPPDPVSQILIAIPLVLLYELSIWIASVAVKRHERELSAALSKQN